MKFNNNLDLESQFETYVKSNGFDKMELPPRLFREIKRAFYGGSAQTMAVLHINLPVLPFEEAIKQIAFMHEQIINFFSADDEYKKDFAQKLNRRKNCDC
jgi:hypothetical protein